MTRIPAVVTRCILYMYMNQNAWTKWGRDNSEPFKMTNSTRQGSVLSPTIWSIYIEELIEELRKVNIGCTVGGVYMGIIVYADDVALLAPSRRAMELMLRICEKFAAKNNVVYSTDPNPTLSKSKCLYMTGKENKSYPVPLTLNGKSLPWVRNATHLGHEISEKCNMELDTKIKRARFIENTTNIRETFAFAHPRQILRAIETYAVHLFGSNL